MKYFYMIFGAFLLTGYSSYAQNTPWSPSGFIGIATTNPAYPLQVGANIWANLGPGYVFAAAGDIVIGNATPGSQPQLTIHEGTTGAFASLQKYNGYTKLTDSQGAIYLNGNVSIGTADAKGYKLAVNGSAIATSMTIKLYSTWPDYVFKKGYRLPSLSEVKAYVDQNQHLPEMPSEQEIVKNGLNLGEMNELLMKKVEELTLYLIEKDDQLKKQQQALKGLQKQLNKINRKLNRQ